jgi:hypothetical protein
MPYGIRTSTIRDDANATAELRANTALCAPIGGPS